MRSNFGLLVVGWIGCTALAGCSKKEETPTEPPAAQAEGQAAQPQNAAPAQTTARTVNTTRTSLGQVGLGAPPPGVVSGSSPAEQPATGQPGSGQPTFKLTGAAGQPTATATSTAAQPTGTSTAAPPPPGKGNAATPGRGVPPPPGGRPKPGSK